MNEKIVNPITGEFINLDSSDEQVADFMLEVARLNDQLQEVQKQIRKYIEERVQSTDNNFGGKFIKIQYKRFKEYALLDEVISKKYELLKQEAEEKNKEAKSLFDGNKVEVGTEKVTLAITLPKN